MNADCYPSNAKAAVGEENTIDGELGAPAVLHTGILGEMNDRCDKELRVADLNASTSTAINSERIDLSVIYLSFTSLPHLITLRRGAKPSAALLSIMNDDTIDTR